MRTARSIRLPRILNGKKLHPLRLYVTRFLHTHIFYVQADEQLTRQNDTKHISTLNERSRNTPPPASITAGTTSGQPAGPLESSTQTSKLLPLDEVKQCTVNIPAGSAQEGGTTHVSERIQGAQDPSVSVKYHCHVIRSDLYRRRLKPANHNL